MSTWLFRPPTIDEGPAVPGSMLMRFFKVTQGITILDNGGTYRAVRYPTVDETTAATNTYMGGHEYVVNDATRTALIAGGVGVTSANFTALP
jgi:hypothetical protein